MLINWILVSWKQTFPGVLLKKSGGERRSGRTGRENLDFLAKQWQKAHSRPLGLYRMIGACFKTFSSFTIVNLCNPKAVTEWRFLYHLKMQNNHFQQSIKKKKHHHVLTFPKFSQHLLLNLFKRNSKSQIILVVTAVTLTSVFSVQTPWLLSALASYPPEEAGRARWLLWVHLQDQLCSWPWSMTTFPGAGGLAGVSLDCQVWLVVRTPCTQWHIHWERRTKVEDHELPFSPHLRVYLDVLF